jgi:hypothetical protein
MANNNHVFVFFLRGYVCILISYIQIQKNQRKMYVNLAKLVDMENYQVLKQVGCLMEVMVVMVEV